MTKTWTFDEDFLWLKVQTTFQFVWQFVCNNASLLMPYLHLGMPTLVFHKDNIFITPFIFLLCIHALYHLFSDDVYISNHEVQFIMTHSWSAHFQKTNLICTSQGTELECTYQFEINERTWLSISWIPVTGV